MLLPLNFYRTLWKTIGTERLMCKWSQTYSRSRQSTKMRLLSQLKCVERKNGISQSELSRDYKDLSSVTMLSGVEAKLSHEMVTESDFVRSIRPVNASVAFKGAFENVNELFWKHSSRKCVFSDLFTEKIICKKFSRHGNDCCSLFVKISLAE